MVLENMLLFHFSRTPLRALSPVSPVPDNDHKPGGLWLSDESEFGWSKLLQAVKLAGDPHWADADDWFRNVYEFDIDSSKLICLRSEADIWSFRWSYGESQPRMCAGQTGVHIQWSLVKARYKGILVSPYHDSLSHRNGASDMHWYRFDCASACVWDTSVVVRWSPVTDSSWR